MFDATVAQLRLASSLATGRRLNLRALEKVTDAMCATVAEFGSVSGDAAQAFTGPVLDDGVRATSRYGRPRPAEPGSVRTAGTPAGRR